MNAMLNNGVKCVIACSVNQKRLQIFLLWNAKFSLPKQTREKPEKHVNWGGYIIITCFCGVGGFSTSISPSNTNQSHTPG